MNNDLNNELINDLMNHSGYVLRACPEGASDLVSFDVLSVSGRDLQKDHQITRSKEAAPTWHAPTKINHLKNIRTLQDLINDLNIDLIKDVNNGLINSMINALINDLNIDLIKEDLINDLING